MLDWDVPLLTIRLLIHRSWTQTYTSLAHLGNPFQDGGMNPSPSHLPAVFTHVPPLKWSKVLRARWSAQAWDVPNVTSNRCQHVIHRISECFDLEFGLYSHRIHGAGIYANMTGVY